MPRVRSSRSTTAMAMLVLSVVACTPAPEAAPWVRHEVREANYRVEFPTAPTVTRESTPTGPTITEVDVARLDRGPKGMLQVSHFELAVSPYEIAKAGLDLEPLMRTECLYPTEGSKFVAGTPRRMTLGGQPGIGVTAHAPASESLPKGGWEEDRCVVVNGRMFHLIAIGPDDEATRREGQRFLDSFETFAE